MATETTQDAATQTPAMRQYFTAKAAHPDCLLFCRIGDFYELFYDDAIVASRELQLTLTARDRQKKQPMCGVPYHAAESYIQRLLRKGYRVALCEQMEGPKLTKKVVRREVTRVLTPGTVVDPALGAEQSNWLAGIATRGAGPQTTLGLALLDLSTGDLRATEFTGSSAWALLSDELGRTRPAELILPEGFPSTSRSAPLRLQTAAGEAHAAYPINEQDEPDRAGLNAIRTRNALEDWVFTPDYALPLVRSHFRVHSLDGLGIGSHEVAATAVGALFHYLKKTLQGSLEHIESIHYYERNECLALDAVTVRNLELVDPLFSGESAQTTLFHTLDACCTPMGKRLLRATLLRPSTRLSEINARLDAVAEAAADLRRREAVRRAMEGVLDLERLLGRVASDSAGPREMMALAATLRCLPGVRDAVGMFTALRWRELGHSEPAPAQPSDGISTPISTASFAPPVQEISTFSPHTTRTAHAAPFDTLEDISSLIFRTLADEPPANLSDGGVVRPGVDPELDKLRQLSHSGRQALAAIEDRERQRTGIASLKVRFNSVFGYYLEITKANAKLVPADYERKQTLVNAERFTTPELKEYETKILTAQERSQEIERRLFADLRRTVLAAAPRLRETARRVAEIDLLATFAHTAAVRGWVRPTVDASSTLEIMNGRHPVVERRLEESAAGRFVPNSLSLEAWSPEAPPPTPNDHENPGAPSMPILTAHGWDSTNPAASIALITGPNMGGKSTYLRQAALLVILAQCGSFVPADSMRLGLADRIFTRIGASDNVARGRSTFMVEMTETAAILNTATSRSLVLLDEMGRGTATYDGLSLAWATVEHMHDRIGARTLFATHYHELTLLADRLPRLRNLRVTVKENAQGIVFLHTVEPGPASKSYGIEVARLAGLPAQVIARAREVLRLHERAETQQVSAALARATQSADQPANWVPRPSSPGRDGLDDAPNVTPDHTPGYLPAPALQMTMFTPLSQRIVDRLAALDLDNLTPREALNLLADLQRELTSPSS